MFDTFKRHYDLNERRFLHCNTCCRATIHNLEAKLSGRWQESFRDNHVDGGKNFMLFRCGACDEVCFLSSEWCSEDVEHDVYGNETSNYTINQLPAPYETILTFEKEHIPQQLNSLVDEMLYAAAGSKVHLATAGLRMIIEFIVKDQKCAGKDLKNKIDDLQAKNMVDEEQKEILHSIRLHGNKGVHEGIPMDSAKISSAMLIIQFLIDNFYVKPAKKIKIVRFASDAFELPIAKIAK